MFFAIDENKNRIHIKKANRDVNYFCPCCGNKVILKLGNIRVHHFAHSNDNNCGDSWNYDMSEWHYNWQNKFPIDSQEVVKSFNGQKHRADVLLEEEKVVFEFQHSPLSCFEFEDRNNFYNSLGYKVIWVFDLSDQNNNGQIDNYRDNIWSWKNPKKTFDNYDYKNKNIELYLQLNIEDEELVKVTWCTSDNGLSRFATDGNFYDEEQFVNMFRKNEEIKSNEYKFSQLYDKMIELNSEGHTKYYFGCPISNINKCAHTNIDNIKSKNPNVCVCDECEFFIGGEFDGIHCNKRFFDLNLNGDEIVKIEGKDENGFINKISLMENDELKYINLKTFKLNYANDVFVLWKMNKCKKAVFRNIRTNKYIKIVKDPTNQYKIYGKVYGYISDDKYSFSGKSLELYGVSKKEWIITWFEK